MRQLLNTLYVLSESNYLTLEGENIVIKRDDRQLARYPLHTLESIVCFSYAGASPALMGACAKRGIDLCFFTPRGRFLARTVGEERGNVLLRQMQYRVSDDPVQSIRYARIFVLGKVYNARWVLERATRDHPQRVPVDQLKKPAHSWPPHSLFWKFAKILRSFWAWRARLHSAILTLSIP